MELLFYIMSIILIISYYEKKNGKNIVIYILKIGKLIFINYEEVIKMN
jgi:hypothetical protein